MSRQRAGAGVASRLTMADRMRDEKGDPHGGRKSSDWPEAPDACVDVGLSRKSSPRHLFLSISILVPLIPYEPCLIVVS